MQTSAQPISLEAFLASSASDSGHEFFDGIVIPKMSPKRFHAGVQKSLIKLVDDWAADHGHFYPEWAVILERQGKSWVPVPDLTYISFSRLAADWLEDGPCPLPPDWVIEIISPNQTFGEMLEKATDYLAAGILRVWVIDTKALTVTVFAPDAPPHTYRDQQVITDQNLPKLQLKVIEIFRCAGLVQGIEEDR